MDAEHLFSEGTVSPEYYSIYLENYINLPVVHTFKTTTSSCGHQNNSLALCQVGESHK